MNPVSPDSDNEHSQPLKKTNESDPSGESNGDSVIEPKREPKSEPRSKSKAEENSPVVNLQRRYTDQLSQDIEQLEAQKTQLQGEVAALRQDYIKLQTETRSLRHSASLSASPYPITPSRNTSHSPRPTEKIHTAERGPLLPGEQEVPPPPILLSAPATAESPTVESEAAATEASSNETPLKERPQERSIELPTPATSEQQRYQRIVQPPHKTASSVKTTARRSFVLSAIATLFTAWHYGLVSSLLQGGSWLGIAIGQLGTGFVPAVALLWLRMLVIVPVMVLIAPQLHRTTWEDLLDWFYSREQLIIPLVGSGIALFFSQVFLYQSIGTLGPAIGVAMLFLYPLSSLPLGLWLRQEKALTPFSLLAVVAIAMGGLLVAKPAFTLSSASVGFGLLASLALGLFIVLTNHSYRLRCHPVPTAIVQFSTVAVLSSLVLLIKPLKLVNISWMSFCLWGLLIGALMLVAYLFTYASLLNIRSKTAVIAAATPLAALILGWGFSPRPPLQIIQWTGIMLVSLGGIALGKEKSAKEQLGKEDLNKSL
ncbi:MAG: hypothetical protein AAF810_03995 [Cyanobacteria bacterium P01_D01_bin.36]